MHGETAAGVTLIVGVDLIVGIDRRAGVLVPREAIAGERCGEVRAPVPRRRVPIAGRSKAFPQMRTIARAGRAFMRRMVRFIAAETGVRRCRRQRGRSHAVMRTVAHD